MTQYFVRLRDVISGTERWVDGSDGQRFMTLDRQTADCMALAMSRYQPTEYAYVMEIDPRFEEVS